MRITRSVLAACLIGLTGFSPFSRAVSPEDEAVTSKEAGDGKSPDGLGPLLDGLAVQAVKAFLSDELMNEIPGTTAAEKSENLKTLLSMIEGDKAEVIKSLRKLKAENSIAIGDEQVREKLKKWYPLLKELAGKDGYINHADASPIARGLFDGTISGMATDLAQGIIGRRMNRSGFRIEIDLGNLRGMAGDTGEKLLIQYFDNLGIPRETLAADAAPLKRALWPEIKRQVSRDGGEIAIPDVVNSFRTISRLSSATALRDRVIFSKGLPVAKLERSLTRRELPKDLRLSLDRQTGKLVVR